MDLQQTKQSDYQVNPTLYWELSRIYMEKTVPSYAVIDVETTIFAKGNPFSERNKLCLVGVRINGKNETFRIEYDPTEPYAEALNQIRDCINSVDCVVLFNAKFDLNWLARYGIFLPESVSVFDCQLAEFILGNQRPAYPSLDDCLAKRGLGNKLSSVHDLYWGRGIDTPDIPIDVLTKYLNEDLRLTDDLYRNITADLQRLPSRVPLIRLHQMDLRVLQEMEFNGERLAWDSLADAQAECEEELRRVDENLRGCVGEDFRETFNPDSGDHLSVLLYGGDLSIKVGTPYQRTYKSGPRAGETVLAHKWETRRYTFPQLVRPVDGSRLKKDGFFKTDEETLLSLPRRAVGPLVDLLIRRAELAKLSGTYYKGLPAIAEKYDWKDGFIHGTLSQCNVITGRLSSSKPNKQNFPGILLKYIISRYA